MKYKDILFHAGFQGTGIQQAINVTNYMPDEIGLLREYDTPKGGNAKGYKRRKQRIQFCVCTCIYAWDACK